MNYEDSGHEDGDHDDGGHDDGLDPGRGDERAERAILAAFVIGGLGAIGFGVAYALDLGTQVIGSAIAIAFGGIGYALIGWAHRLMPGAPAVEERHPLSSVADEREAGAQLRAQTATVERRTVLGRAMVGAIGALGLTALFPLASLGPSPGDQLERTDWSKRPRPRLITEDGEPLDVDALAVGEITTVYPEGYPGSADGQALLIRLLSADRAAGSDTLEGYVCYSKVCTHAGCPVGLYEPDLQQLFCPCHQSAFSVPDQSTPVQGPAVRPLARLPLDVDGDGFLIATGDFPEPIGPGYWSRPRKAGGGA